MINYERRHSTNVLAEAASVEASGQTSIPCIHHIILRAIQLVIFSSCRRFHDSLSSSSIELPKSPLVPDFRSCDMSAPIGRHATPCARIPATFQGMIRLPFSSEGRQAEKPRLTAADSFS